MTMKKIFYILILAVSIVSCKKDNNGKLDPNAMISIRPSSGSANVQTKAAIHLSNYEVVRQARNISFYSTTFSGPGTRAFDSKQRDTVNLRLLMWGTDIIDQFGNYVSDFIEGRDFVIRRNLMPNAPYPVWDTIAYIPNSVIVAARSQIRAAYDRSDYETVYSLFNTAFTFTPISGIEWRELKAQGTN